jgi:hypothetical protein
MREIKFTTTRWRFPGALRKQRLRELLGKKSLGSYLGPDFVKGLEARRDMLEARELKLLAWQTPVLLLLALSLLDLDLTASIFGSRTYPNTSNPARRFLRLGGYNGATQPGQAYGGMSKHCLRSGL